jgi:DNA-binding response OmpR family regulator
LLPGFLFAQFHRLGIMEGKPMARILIIDDEPDVRTMVEQILKPTGHEVILAADGREGVLRHQTSPADLVITDLFMPTQDGVETIREFRSRWPEVAIIAMSGNATAETMLVIAQHLGSVGILQKPFVGDELIAAVVKALGARSQAR